MIKFARLSLALGIGFFLFAGSAHAIGSGEVVNADDFEAKSTVIIYGKSGTVCSGTLIAPDLVLTAAHCVVGFDFKQMLSIFKEASDFLVSFNNWPKNGRLTLHQVSGLRVHPSWPKDISNFIWRKTTDLALLRLAANAPTSSVPVKILRENLLQAGSRVTLAGYGHTTKEGTDFGVLRRFFSMVENLVANGTVGQFALFKAQDLPWTKDEYSSADEAKKKVIEEAGIHEGDSGGPAYLLLDGTPFVAGVLSNYDPNDPRAVYQNVAVHSKWIDQTAQELGTRADR